MPVLCPVLPEASPQAGVTEATSKPCSSEEWGDTSYLRITVIVKCLNFISIVCRVLCLALESWRWRAADGLEGDAQ